MLVEVEVEEILLQVLAVQVEVEQELLPIIMLLQEQQIPVVEVEEPDLQITVQVTLVPEVLVLLSSSI